MACRKCGSSWTTIKGADVASCPACCKQQRCRARKQGRLAGNFPESRDCQQCGSQFEVLTPNDKVKRKFCSDECQKKARLLWSREYQRAVAAGDRAPKTTKGRLITSCLACNVKLKSGQYKYCSNACFVRARSDGIQPWDRAAIDEASRKRPSNASESPWLYFHRRCESDMLSFMRKATSLYKSKVILDLVESKSVKPVAADGLGAMKAFLAKLPSVGACPTCSCQFVSAAARKIPHCSRQCAWNDFVEASCTRCGKDMKVHFIGGNFESRKARPMCWRCVIKTHPSQKGKRGHKGRCKKFGVPYDSSIRPHLVFERDNYLCHLCNRKTLPRVVINGNVPHPRSPTIDHHPYPLSAGVMGHEWDNVRCACWECNVRKGAAWSGQRLLFR